MASRKMNLEEAVDFMNKLPDDSQELDVDLDDDDEDLSLDPVIDIPLNSFSEIPDENNNTIDTVSAKHASDFVTIQIMELSANDSFEITSCPKSLFTYEMLDQASTASSLLENNIPT